MKDELLDLYSEYLICSFGQATATGLEQVVNGGVSHDQISRALNSKKRGAADYWQIVKPVIGKMQSAEGVMIVDDTIAEKPYSDENEIVCWHYDHTSGQTIKGIGLLTALYVSNEMALPAEYRLIVKTETIVDKKDGKTKRRPPVSKNELYRQMLLRAKINQIPFKYVLNDVWFASAENMNYVKHDLKKEFVMPLKTNRNVALSADDKRQGIYVRVYVRVDEVELEANIVRQVYLEGISFPLLSIALGKASLSKQRWQHRCVVFGHQRLDPYLRWHHLALSKTVDD